MADPTPYLREFGFANFQASHPSDPLPGDQVDAELNAIETADLSLASSIRDVRRSDGALRNTIVTPDSLAPSTLALITAVGANPRGAWLTTTAYAVKDIATQSGNTYICVTAHTSGVFATDLAAGKWMVFSGASPAVSTRSFSVTAGAGTYNTPTNCRQIIVRMKAPGGGGSASGISGGTAGGDGADSSFNSIVAKGGKAGLASGQGGLGGANGTGGATLRTPGAPGQSSSIQIWSATNFIGLGGNGGGKGGGVTPINGSGAAGVAGVANSGAGGSGGSIQSVDQTTYVTYLATGGGGGEGEEILIVISNPAPSYSFVMGTAGNAGSAGVNGSAGAQGALGFLDVEERY